MFKKIAVIFGTRPEAIKLFPVIKELKKRNVDVTVINTGQHGEMLDKVIYDLGIDVDIEGCTDSVHERDLADRSSYLFLYLEMVFKQEKFDLVIVQGDTATAFFGALAAYYNRIPIAHVEAGLRTFDKYNPFPEEMYRQMIDILSDYCFCPNYEALWNVSIMKNGECGVKAKSVFVTGNTVVDTLLHFAKIVNPVFPTRTPENYVLITLHRRETWTNKGIFIEVMDSLLRIAKFCPDHHFWFVDQHNPFIDTLKKVLSLQPENWHFTQPQGYCDFVSNLMFAKIVITDSGGVQEEACTLGVPCLLLRDKTERPENVGENCLQSPRDKLSIIRNFAKMYRKPKAYAFPIECYGDGKAGKKIVDLLLKD